MRELNRCSPNDITTARRLRHCRPPTSPTRPPCRRRRRRVGPAVACAQKLLTSRLPAPAPTHPS